MPSRGSARDRGFERRGAFLSPSRLLCGGALLRTLWHSLCIALEREGRECIETCIDCEKGYAAAAADVRDPALKTLFQERSKERADFVLALQEALQRMGAFAENEGTAKAIAHRGWVDIRLAVEGRSDRVVVEKCARDEQSALKAYKKALRRAPLSTLPEELRTLLQGQYASIQSAIDDARKRLVTLH